MVKQVTTLFPTVTQASSREVDPERLDSSIDQFVEELNVLHIPLNEIGTQINEVAEEVNQNAQTATTKAAEAAQSVADAASQVALATQQADIAKGYANFKGEWSSLTGALSLPASVLHNDTIWVLLNDLVDVTLSEPSESNSDWYLSSGGQAGGGVPLGAAVVLKGRAETLLEENGGLYLRSGFVETDVSLYPDAPVSMFVDPVKTFSENVVSPYSKKLQDTLEAANGNNMLLPKFVDSGNKLFFHTGTDSAAIVDLNTPYDPCTADPLTVQVVTLGGARNLQHSVMSENGLYVYGVSTSIDGVYRYSLTTAYDLTTITSTYDQSILQTINQYSIDINPSGTQLIVGALNATGFYYLNMSTPYSLSGSLAIRASYLAPYNSYIKYIDNGNKLLVSYNEIYKLLSLSSPYDVSSTLTEDESGEVIILSRYLHNQIIDHGAALRMTPDVLGLTVEPATNFSLINGFTASLSADTEYRPWFTHFEDARFTNSGAKLFLLDRYGLLTEYSLPVAYDVSSASLQNILVYPRDSYLSTSINSRNFDFYNNGLNLYVFERDGGYSTTVNLKKFTLTQAYDLSTASLSESKTLSWGTLIHDIKFNGDGSKLFILNSTDRILEVSLLTPYVIEDTQPAEVIFDIPHSGVASMSFNTDGSELYFVEYGGGNQLITYKLSTPYDISSLVEVDSTPLGYASYSFLSDDNGGWVSSNYIKGVSKCVGLSTQFQDFGGVAYMRVK